MRSKTLSSNFSGKSKSHVIISFANHEFILDGEGCLYWPRHELLIVSDLHLEKASFLASFGQPLPLYDTRDTLMRLEFLVERYKPRTLLTLGDNFHDTSALNRIHIQNVSHLKQICASVEQCLWIVGNHDEAVDFSLTSNLFVYDEYFWDGILFTHLLRSTDDYQILGHYHPKISVKKTSGKCFLLSDKVMILPAFGSFTGGLDVNSCEFLKATQLDNVKAYLLYNKKIWRAK